MRIMVQVFCRFENNVYFCTQKQVQLKFDIMNDIETAKEKKAKIVRDEVVANSSQSEASEPNGNHLEKGEITLSQHDIEKLIITVRGVQVMIDRDLAMLYGVETKRLNEQVKRNVARFPERYRFQLTREEMTELVANCDRFKTLKHSTTTPFAFTEYGVSMLPSVLSSQKAIDS